MLPAPAYAEPAEGYAPSVQAVGCDTSGTRVGIEAFRDWVLERVGGADVGIDRNCGVGAPSLHHERRAWDWGVDAGKPAEAALADELIAWLLAPGPTGDHENARRAGLQNIIWNKRIWLSSTHAWQPYDGFNAEGVCTKPAGGCRDPHTSHVHFSFSWPGARGETSFYRWLAAGGPSSGEPWQPAPGPPGRPGAAGRAALAVLAFAAGLGAALALPKALRRRRGR